MPRYLLLLFILAIIIYAILDCVRTPSDSMPGRLPKVIWILIILVIAPPIGSIAWIFASRVSRAESQDGTIKPTLWSNPEASSVRLPQIRFGSPQNFDSSSMENQQQLAPDDDPEFLAQVEAQLRKRQREEYEKNKNKGFSEKDATENETNEADNPQKSSPANTDNTGSDSNTDNTDEADNTSKDNPL